MFNWKRSLIGSGIFLAAYYIIGLFGENVVLELILAGIILPITVYFMFDKGKTDVVEEGES